MFNLGSGGHRSEETFLLGAMFWRDGATLTTRGHILPRRGCAGPHGGAGAGRGGGEAKVAGAAVARVVELQVGGEVPDDHPAHGARLRHRAVLQLTTCNITTHVNILFVVFVVCIS